MDLTEIIPNFINGKIKHFVKKIDLQNFIYYP